MAAPDISPLGKVMVIGGMGFVGHHVVKLLAQRYQTDGIFVVDLRAPSGSHQLEPKPGVRISYHEADITDPHELELLFTKTQPDVVIHTASPLPQVETVSTRMLYDKVNIEGTRSVVKACQAHAVKALVYTSSASVISDHRSDLCNADERWPRIKGVRQREYYAESKAKAEEIVLAANNRQGHRGLLTAAIRPSAIFGEGDKMIVPRFISIFRQGKAYYQLGDNQNLFDFTYVVNVAHAHLLAAQILLTTANNISVGERHLGTSQAPRVDGECFFITNDTPIYFWDFARAVWIAAGFRYDISKVWVIPRGLAILLAIVIELLYSVVGKKAAFNRQSATLSCATRYYDISKAKFCLGYQPLVPLNEAIDISVKWCLEVEKKPNTGNIPKIQ